MTKRLTFPAPSREWYWSGEGWASRKWAEQGVRDVLAADGWFQKGRSSFANPAVAKLAGVADG